MPSPIRRIYWDACVFLHYFERTPDKIGTLDVLLDDSAKRNGIEIITSVLSVVEVAYVSEEKRRGAVDPLVEKALDDFWMGGEAVKLVEYHYLIGLEARRLIRTLMPSGKRLGSADAVHLATARHLGAVEFHTYETGLIAKSEDVGLTICEPYTASPRLPLEP